METNKLYNIAENQGITVDFISLCENPALSLELNGKGFIAIDKNLTGTPAAEKVALAHELGHLATGALYSAGADCLTVGKMERAAQKWAVNALVPYRELLKALEAGEEDLTFLAARFGVTEDFMQRAIQYYSESRPVLAEKY